MSRSINDYKDAMDRIRISESFYKRTETMLADLSEDRLGNSKSAVIRRRISAGIMAAAACIVCVIGAKVVLDVRKENIGSVSETGLTSISTETVTQVQHSPDLIDVPEPMDIELEDPAIYDTTGADASAEETEEEAADAAADTSSDAAALISYSAEQFSIPVPDAAIEEGIEGVHNDANYIEHPEDADGYIGAGSGSAGVGTDSEDELSGYPDIRIEGRNDIPDLKEILPENVRFAVTSYIESKELDISNEEKVIDGAEASAVFGMLKNIPSDDAKIPNGDFRTVFMIQITEIGTGDIFYSIYITDEMTAVITRHSDPQQRSTYILTEDKYVPLTKALFMLYGSEEEYLLFETH